MPITKIEKESALYFEIKAKYESKCKVEPLAKEYGLTREYLSWYAKQEKWERGKLKSIYDATKIFEQEKILTQFKKDNEKKADLILSQKAKEEGEKLAIRKLQSESYKIEIENKLAEVGMKYLDKFADSLDNIKGGKVVDTEIEGVVIDENGKPANIITKTTVLRPKEFEKVIAMMQAFGILQTTPTVAIQNNNNAEAKVENKTIDEQLEKIKHRADFQEFVGKLKK